MRVTGYVIAVLLVMAGTFSAQAQTAVPATPVEPAKTVAAAPVTFGGDLRLREEYYNNLRADKTGNIVGYDENNYLRLRSRVWTQWDMCKNASIYLRVANEFRYVMAPDDDETGDPATDAKIEARNHTWKFPDELIVDNLYIDLKGVCGGKVDARIGRQDLMYGTGKLVLEGTPNDGSRTVYSDAVKISFKGIPKNTVDFFGIYNQTTNDLVFGNENRALINTVEKGGGVYLMNKNLAVCPFEAYYMFKQEEDVGTSPSRNLNTIGFRVMPKDKAISANFETAYQFGGWGGKDVYGSMVDAMLSYEISKSSMKPTVKIGCYYLSGDNPTTTGTDEGWNPLWARYPQYSELYVYAYGGPGRWSNVTMPYIGASVELNKNVKIKAQISDLTAPEDDGPGPGHRRGLLGQINTEFTISNALFGKNDKLTGHVLADVLKQGDYYGSYETAVFARWQLMYVF